MKFDRIIVLFLLLLASTWAALVNGGPFFMQDTTAYVREPDFAVVYLLGPKFATSWTQESTIKADKNTVQTTNSTSINPRVPLNAPFQKAILAGRSFYYGALLYVGHLISLFWLSIFMQAAIFLYLTYTITIKGLRLSIVSYACIIGIALLGTPLSFFVGFLMPDIFASYLILGTIIIAAFWAELNLRDKILVGSITCFAALAHTSHLLLLIFLSVVFVVVSVFTKGHPQAAPRIAFKRFAVLLAIVLIGIGGELAFDYGTHQLVHAYPVRPPFLTARLIADGPGYKYLRDNCSTSRYVVCDYLDRLPTPADNFLWSTEPTNGVFNVADPKARRKMSAQQIPFFIDVFKFDPLGVTTSVIKNAISQLQLVGLNEFFPDHAMISQLKQKLPASYFERFMHSHIIFRDWLLKPLNIWFSTIYLVTLACLALAGIIWPFVRFGKVLNVFAQPQWYYIVYIALSALVFNSVICGALSQPADRYQARIAWIPVFLISLMVVTLQRAVSSTKRHPDFFRRVVQALPRPFRFLSVGSIGLATDIASFTVIAAFSVPPLIARLGSLAIATLATWRLNRAITFSNNGRRQRDEAIRYAIVTAVAQGISYSVFAILLQTPLAKFPQIAIVIGAAVATVFSYNGHRLLTFSANSRRSPGNSSICGDPIKDV